LFFDSGHQNFVLEISTLLIAGKFLYLYPQPWVAYIEILPYTELLSLSFMAKRIGGQYGIREENIEGKAYSSQT
jgi:hypothetical protein